MQFTHLTKFASINGLQSEEFLLVRIGGIMREEKTSPIRQQCVLTVSLRVLTLAQDLDGQTDEDRVSNEALKILTT